MPTLIKSLAEQLIDRIKDQEKPRVLCVFKYTNASNNETDYVYCNNIFNYETMLSSPFVTEVEILWASKGFKVYQDSKLSPEAP